MPKKRKPTSDAVEIMDRRYYERRPERIAELEEAQANDEVARKIYELRTRLTAGRHTFSARMRVHDQRVAAGDHIDRIASDRRQ